ncbi:MAG: RNA 2',3'-cyclic phosphodiesterase [Kiritimatiellales bacterium]|nr:RNA 2',3'-cyclic phosphodiesterase [Kiritimatiellales bacterium]
METVRAFIAVELNDAVRGELAGLQRRLKKAHADVRWVRTEGMHLTLAFLGDVPVEKFQPLETALDESFQSLEPFSVKATGIGTFGKPSRPRVVWAGIADGPPLMELQHKTVQALRKAAVDFDEKPFSPHLTLGRVKSPKNIQHMLELFEKEQATEFGSVDVTEVLLMKSELKPTGAEHTVLHRFPLHGQVKQGKSS